MTFFRDCRPEKMTRYPAASDGIASSSSPAAVSSPSPSAEPSHRVLRTVYLPSERADALLLTVQSLQSQVDGMKRLMEERSEAWRKDRQAREETHKRKEEADAAQMAALEKDLEKTKDKLRAVTEGAAPLLSRGCVCVRE